MKSKKVLLKTILIILSIFITAPNAFALIVEWDQWDRPVVEASARTVVDLMPGDIEFTGSGNLSEISMRTTADISGFSAVENPESAYVSSESGNFSAWGGAELEYPWGTTGDPGVTLKTDALTQNQYWINGNIYGYSNSSAALSGKFSAETEGTLSISIYYEFWVGCMQGIQGETAWAESSVLLDINGEQDFNSITVFATRSGITRTIIKDFDEWDKLTVSYYLDAGQEVDFTFQTSAKTLTATPIPGSILFMWTSLLCIAGIWRRKHLA